ncbi:hypothetical protein JMJ77_0014340 [Colletotrichum scovillei]|uniref:Uncharacterized protein n=1 Tax=Colletotrichum scovillei TaxID=1209932 RepID=A0A9P7R6H9_9PEZI|nr:hypothetical protein JMJ77_0014340 [Colletotrichum scovillei]KAG7065905.1 hypothetical protein JMJ78_0012648 [Colletotrichum scovillei]KAG7068473.1 hypothetical protein JMJ76_0008160 [Colletotrichum scovillei]
MPLHQARPSTLHHRSMQLSNYQHHGFKTPYLLLTEARTLSQEHNPQVPGASEGLGVKTTTKSTPNL